jgi:pyruvate dehydrogenase E2 component (dihydrolipoamide acetyltransferase)
MATAIEMPKLGNTVEECLLARWAKRKGERVEAGELVAEIETDKANFDLTAPASGTLLETFFNDGELIPVFTCIGVIGAPGEDAERYRPGAHGTTPAPGPRLPAPNSPLAPAPRPASPGAALTPRARRFAREHDFHPPQPGGSGPGGRVLEADLVRLYHESPRLSYLARRQAAEGREPAGPGSGIGGRVLARDLGEPPIPLAGVREKIARRMRESLASTAQYTLDASADATGLLALRGRFKARETAGAPQPTIHDLVLFCAVRALVEMPALNAELIDGKLYRRAAVHLAFACDTDRGLLAPVIRNAQALSLIELAARARELAAAATAGAVAADDLAGATFTVSNLGGLGIESFTPILNPPQVGILGVGTIRLQPVRRGGEVAFIDRIGLSLTCDHQAIDGAPGARFLAVLRKHIENVEKECTT